ncbi:ABC transporter permease subunit [Granulicatella sp. zg-ZJ]|uniref:ABC transporter permease n=1 Tax=unclassified Granulicatella TaxID=2630493 RepID=UPI0013BF0D11|nr:MULTISPECIES: ABC transporter permease [unclassified Granulicatella]MBS4749812.1 ABC transporter permease [Carnobacteriaceae bacterium zg-ZUI78]NEW61914.1 ABC transporter permease subunit [Granulicatella sp. zg-ZJ]NEW66248.1 ABC transporter permease subunit [Granulicatella sp. zg-84]QMI85912.1 ABC transporter permease [Carnobacteriaceae bacterium zg-84]
MLKMIRKSVIHFVVILLCVTFLSFLFIYLAPGDPAESILSAQGIPYTQELLALKRHEFGFDKSFIEQYGIWLFKILQGDFGVTYNSGASVWEQLIFYFPNTVYLALYILLATLTISIPFALISAYYEHSKMDRAILMITGFINAIPGFVIGILLMIIFSVQLKLLPIQSTANELGLILPVLTVSITMSTRYIPQMRTHLIDELHSPSVEGARGRGIPEWRILLFDVLGNTLPFLLTLVSLSLGSLLGGVAIIENLFSWPGIGKLLITVAGNRDYPLIQGIVLFITAGVLVVNLVFQIVIAWLNPRTRKEALKDMRVKEVV